MHFEGAQSRNKANKTSNLPIKQEEDSIVTAVASLLVKLLDIC